MIKIEIHLVKKIYIQLFLKMYDTINWHNNCQGHGKLFECKNSVKKLHGCCQDRPPLHIVLTGP